jgi:hypothetical protein
MQGDRIIYEPRIFVACTKIERVILFLLYEKWMARPFFTAAASETADFQQQIKSKN